MQLQFEKKEDIPSDSIDEFVEHTVDDNVIWMHKDLAESKKLAFRIKGDLTRSSNDFESLKSKISKEQKEASELAEAEKKKAIEELRKKLSEDGNSSELQKLELQQAEDKYNSLVDSNETLQQNFTKLEDSLVATSNLNLATEIASQFVPSEMVKSFSKLLIADHIKNVDGKPFFTNAGGDAVDGDMNRIIEVLSKDPELKHFAKFPGSRGGVGANGGSGGVDGKTISRKDFIQLLPHQRSQAMRKGITLID